MEAVIPKKLKSEWGKSFPKFPTDHIQLDNRFVGKKPFAVSYKHEPRPNMSHLLSWEYSRMWKSEHNEYLKQRETNAKLKFIKPKIEYKLPKIVKSEKKLDNLTKSKKYQKVCSKINTGKML